MKMSVFSEVLASVGRRSGDIFRVKCGHVGHLFTICGPKWAQVLEMEPQGSISESKGSPILSLFWPFLEQLASKGGQSGQKEGS